MSESRTKLDHDWSSVITADLNIFNFNWRRAKDVEFVSMNWQLTLPTIAIRVLLGPGLGD